MRHVWGFVHISFCAFTACILLFGCTVNCSKTKNLGPPSASEYILPYSVGQSSEIFQSYCAFTGHRNRLAYDFRMPRGAAITAARSGVVVEIVNDYRDDDNAAGHNNRVLIRHRDNTVAWYAHLQKGSVLVGVGDRVGAAQPIGSCGTSGRSGNIPHLHFEVFQSIPYRYSDAIPINFRNVSGETDSLGVLITERTYKALPDSGKESSFIDHQSAYRKGFHGKRKHQECVRADYRTLAAHDRRPAQRPGA